MAIKYPDWLPGEPDFSGWATKNDTLCSDGVTIKENAFVNQNRTKVPLVWQHKHGAPVTILGHAYLENRQNGVYAYAYCNGTDSGVQAKEIVQHGDVESFSIFADTLTKKGMNIVHGIIREVSLVLAGANPGAMIDVPYIEHLDSDEVTEAYMYNDEKELTISHAKNADEKKTEIDDDTTVGEILSTLTEPQAVAVSYVMNELAQSVADELSNIDDDEDDDDDNTNNNKKNMEDNMKHNLFENYDSRENTISHSEFVAVVDNARKTNRSSLANAMEEAFGSDVIAHAYPTNEGGGEQKYGMSNIGYLFPDARMTEDMPGFIKRDTGWVSNFMNATYKSPFSRIKSVFANITEDEARAKGYVKGKEKVEEVFSLLKRVTTPCTVYKKQKLDRDDIIDITSFDVVRLIKEEMRIMLDEEIARAALVGDGRVASHADKIKEDCIRPIAKDDNVYNIRVDLTAKTADDSTKKAQSFIDAMIRARKNYKGSGSPTLYITEDMLADLQLMRDNTGRDLFTSTDQIATKLRVKEIVTVPVFDGVKLDTDKPLVAIMVNPFDYGIGTDKGGEVNVFDNFDIDFNQYKYLMETRCSGALRLPYSAITVTMKVTA